MPALDVILDAGLCASGACAASNPLLVTASRHDCIDLTVLHAAKYAADSRVANDASDVAPPACRQTVVQWQEALKSVPGLKAIDSLQPEKSAVSEVLNLAWARHELISDNVDEVRSCSCSWAPPAVTQESCAAQHAQGSLLHVYDSSSPMRHVCHG